MLKTMRAMIFFVMLAVMPETSKCAEIIASIMGISLCNKNATGVAAGVNRWGPLARILVCLVRPNFLLLKQRLR